MRNSYFAILVSALWVASQSAQADQAKTRLPVAPNQRFVLDEQSQKVADCADVTMYAINWYLMANNEGAAKLMVLQTARAQMALLFKFYDNGTVSGDKVTAFSAKRQTNKAMLDADQANLPAYINRCTPIISRSNDEQAGRRTKVWGKDYYEAVHDTATKLRDQLGMK